MILSLLISVLSLAAPPIERIQAPTGFTVSLYAEAEGARSLALGSDGTVYVGTRDEKVFALLPDNNGDGKSDRVVTLADDLDTPNGVAFKDGDLYIAEVSRILRIKKVDPTKKAKPEPWGPRFPTETHHGWKFIAFGPDGWLYVPVGAPCNSCLKDQNTYAAIHRVSPDGKKREIVARGVRNTVGFDWHPDTKELWFTDNGRDWLGDDIPPCELNRVKKAGEHFGFPFCHGRSVSDPEFGKERKCADFAPPIHEFPAHSAPLGMRFLRRQRAPFLRDTVLVAEHGSWNRSTPIGYQVTAVTVSKDGGKGAKPFLTGFRRGSSAWGRPVDILELPDGSILVSDDKAGAVYRVTYEGRP